VFVVIIFVVIYIITFVDNHDDSGDELFHEPKLLYLQEWENPNQREWHAFRDVVMDVGPFSQNSSRWSQQTQEIFRLHSQRILFREVCLIYEYKLDANPNLIKSIFYINICCYCWLKGIDNRSNRYSTTTSLMADSSLGLWVYPRRSSSMRSFFSSLVIFVFRYKRLISFETNFITIIASNNRSFL
jgi:hypothetical protein